MTTKTNEVKTPMTLEATNDYLKHNGISKGDIVEGYEIVTTYEGGYNEAWGVKEAAWEAVSWEVYGINYQEEDFIPADEQTPQPEGAEEVAQQESDLFNVSRSMFSEVSPVFTPERVARIIAEMSKHAAGEAVDVRFFNCGNDYYVFTTELGMYRIADKYQQGKALQSKGYSDNLEGYYLSFRLQF